MENLKEKNWPLQFRMLTNTYTSQKYFPALYSCAVIFRLILAELEMIQRIRRGLFYLLVLLAATTILYNISTSISPQITKWMRRPDSTSSARPVTISQKIACDNPLQPYTPILSQTVSNKEPNTNCRRKAVIIVAPPRTGSTFLGEYFNQHSEVYYLFEPLHGIGYEQQYVDKRRNVLLDLMKCNYSRIPELYSDSKNDRWVKCKSNLCFADRSEFLWRNTDICTGKKPYCGIKKFDPRMLERICKRSLFTAIKTIAVTSLHELEPVLLDPELDVRVIQLVRDPRAVIPSFLKMMDLSNGEIENISRSTCNSYSKNINYLKKFVLHNSGTLASTNSCSSDSIRKSWNGRLMRLSHEYLSQYPFESLKMIYGFVQLNHDSIVTEWLRENTGPTGALPYDSSKKQSLASGFYGTSRNSSEVLKSWRMKQSISSIVLIQKLCENVMTELGYIPVQSENQLKNLSVSLHDYKKALSLP